MIKNHGIITATFKEGIGEYLIEESEFDNCLRYNNFRKVADIVRFARETRLNIIDIHYYNERTRFNPTNRDLNFIVVTFTPSHEARCS